MIVYIYDIKTLQIVARPIVESYDDFKKNPTKFYPNWNIVNNISTLIEFNDPKLVNGNIYEKTREDKILLDNKIELLQDGEYVENNKIIIVPAPEDLFQKLWNKELHIWEEGATLVEIEKILRENIINKTSELVKIQAAGFGDSKLELELKILREKHMNITHEIANLMEV